MLVLTATASGVSAWAGRRERFGFSLCCGLVALGLRFLKRLAYDGGARFGHVVNHQVVVPVGAFSLPIAGNTVMWIRVYAQLRRLIDASPYCRRYAVARRRFQDEEARLGR